MKLLLIILISLLTSCSGLLFHKSMYKKYQIEECVNKLVYDDVPIERAYVVCNKIYRKTNPVSEKEVI